jgi:DNA-binding transcriptional LysR family regulator
MSDAHKRFDAMDLNLLRVFEAVFRERHLTRAARALSVTPSAVSHALRRLRDVVDDPLFQRESSRMVPTATCERTAPALLEQLAQLRALLDQWGRFAPEESTQTFHLGMPESVEPFVLASLWPSFRAAAPRASILSVAFRRAELARKLSLRQLDVAIDVAFAAPAEVRHEALVEDELCVVARRSRRAGRALTWERYRDARHIVVSARAAGSVLEDVALAQLGVERRVAVRCRSYATALRLVEASDDLLTMPARLALGLGETLSLVRLRLPAKLPPVSLHVYWHANSDADPSNLWLRGLMRRVASASGLRRRDERRAAALSAKGGT